VELRVIEKPVVHPDRRFISLVHARRYTQSFSPIISPFYLLPSSRRLLSRSHLPHVGIRTTRKAGEEKRGATSRCPSR